MGLHRLVRELMIIDATMMQDEAIWVFEKEINDFIQNNYSSPEDQAMAYDGALMGAKLVMKKKRFTAENLG